MQHSIDNIGNGLQVCKILQNERLNELLKENRELKERLYLSKYYAPIMNDMDRSEGNLYVSVTKPRFSNDDSFLFLNLPEICFRITYKDLERIKYYLEKDGFRIEDAPKKEKEANQNIIHLGYQGLNEDGMDFIIF